MLCTHKREIEAAKDVSCRNISRPVDIHGPWGSHRHLLSAHRVLSSEYFFLFHPLLLILLSYSGFSHLASLYFYLYTQIYVQALINKSP